MNDIKFAYILHEGYWQKTRVFLNLETACRYTAKAIVKLCIEDAKESEKFGYADGTEYLKEYYKIKDSPVEIQRKIKQVYQEKCNPTIFNERGQIWTDHMLLEKYEIIHKVNSID